MGRHPARLLVAGAVASGALIAALGGAPVAGASWLPLSVSDSSPDQAAEGKTAPKASAADKSAKKKAVEDAEATKVEVLRGYVEIVGEYDRTLDYLYSLEGGDPNRAKASEKYWALEASTQAARAELAAANVAVRQAQQEYDAVTTPEDRAAEKAAADKAAADKAAAEKAAADRAAHIAEKKNALVAATEARDSAKTRKDDIERRYLAAQNEHFARSFSSEDERRQSALPALDLARQRVQAEADLKAAENAYQKAKSDYDEAAKPQASTSLRESRSEVGIVTVPLAPEDHSVDKTVDAKNRKSGSASDADIGSGRDGTGSPADRAGDADVKGTAGSQTSPSGVSDESESVEDSRPETKDASESDSTL